MRKGVYVASRATPERSAMWRQLRTTGVPIISSWIDQAEKQETADFSDLWVRMVDEIHRSEFLLLYVEGLDFPLKGALVEVGIALAEGIPVKMVLPGILIDPVSYRPIGSWIKHPLVEICRSIPQVVIDGGFL